MNERIKELWSEAAESNGGNSWEEQTEFMQKFAELIVRKCIESTLSLRDTAIDNEWNLDETFHMIVDTIVEDLDMQHIFRS